MKNPLLCAVFITAVSVLPATADTIVVGANGLSWRDGGGEIQAKVIRSAQSVENTNAPGGVIDFAVAGFADWIFPQRADTTLNIALGANPSRAAVRSPRPTTSMSAANWPSSLTTTARVDSICA